MGARTKTPPPMLTVPKAAKALGISLAKMQSLILKQRITYVAIEDVIRIPQTAIDAYLRKNTIEAR